MLINPKNLLVVGDLMVDHYTYGRVKRISPEAPVPILQVEREEDLPGGAGNVMSNLCSLGMRVFALGRVGADSAGKACVASLKKRGIETEGILVDSSFITPVKNRMIADTQQMVRVDYERVTPLSMEIEEKARKHFSELLPKIDAIAISDYAKGFCSEALLQELIAQAKVPVIADPKSTSFVKYRGATLLKPNLSEAIRAANLTEEASLDHVAEAILEGALCEYLMITRSAAGISLFGKEGRKDFPAEVKEVKDVTGAGDTVLAVITASLANGLGLDEATILANRAASHVVQRVGCAQVTLHDL